MPPIDIAPLEKSIAALARSLEALSKMPPSDPLFEHLRAGVVQNFQVAHEMCFVFLRRYAILRGGAGKSPRDARDIFRIGLENGLIDDVDHWLAHRKTRNITSRSYDEKRADQVAAGAGAFLEDAQALAARLRERLAE